MKVIGLIVSLGLTACGHSRAIEATSVGVIRIEGSNRFAHYELVVDLRRDGEKILTLDPASGWRDQPTQAFFAQWAAADHVTIILSAT